LNRKKWISPILSAVLVIVALLLVYADHRFTAQLTDQTLTKRWSDDGSFSQVSCFFDSGSGLSEDALVPLRYQLNEALTEAGISAETETETGRFLVDAYSAVSTLTIASTRGSTDARAVGVGGDFFLFHPMTLLSGTYFDGDDLNSDGVILDEDVAWKLFGSYNVDGMEVTIGDVVYPVRGVVRRSTGAYSKAAGEEDATIYVSYGILPVDASEMTGSVPIETYELLIRTPVTGFGVTSLTEALGLDEGTYEMVENSSRFSLSHRWKVLKEFGARSMRTSNLVLPYWENRARAYEDAAVLFMLLEGLLLLYPAIYILYLLIALFRRCRHFSAKAAAEQLTGWIKRIKR
jgi:hypothetical protein